MRAIWLYNNKIINKTEAAVFSCLSLVFYYSWFRNCYAKIIQQLDIQLHIQKHFNCTNLIRHTHMFCVMKFKMGPLKVELI